MKKNAFLFILLFISFSSAAQLKLSSGRLNLVLNNKGYLSEITDIENNVQYISRTGETDNPLLVLHCRGKSYMPTSLKQNGKDLIRIFYGSKKISALIRIKQNPVYVSFELTEVKGINPEAVQWGPYSTSITKVIGETVGVVRDDAFAIGIQALNMHTIGGILKEYYQVSDKYAGMFREDYHNRTATFNDGRSELRAYTREKEGGISGSAIAFFGCSPDKVLDCIGQIELAENLPHPTFSGIWGKVSPVMKENWMVSNISESNVDDIIEFARKANLKIIHTMDPFETWGNFALDKRYFPNGRDGLKKCVEKAAKYNIAIGIHVLSNFITTNDPYVTPVPDKRLANELVTKLDRPAMEDDTIIYIVKPDNIEKIVWNNNLRTLRVDDELIQYGRIDSGKPFRLLGCRRGAFGTHRASHESGTEVAKLWDHGYKVFFPSFTMQKEMAARIADLINYTGVKEISFDGLEGCFFSGYGMYASVQFVKDCIERVDHEIFCDASIINHNLWHYFSRMSWGDENYQSATRVGTLKFQNQAFYNRNYIPPMMGAGLKLSTKTRNRLASTVDDAEWQLSKNAGYGSGYGIDASQYTIKNLGNIEEIISISNTWEEARALNAFTKEQREKLADPAGEWHLEKTAEKNWLLYPVEFHESVYKPDISGNSSFSFINRFDTQKIFITIHVPGENSGQKTSIVNPSVSLGGKVLTFPVTLTDNQYIVYQGEKAGLLYDENWHLLREIVPEGEIPVIETGNQVLLFHADNDQPAKVSLRIRTIGKPEQVTSR